MNRITYFLNQKFTRHYLFIFSLLFLSLAAQTIHSAVSEPMIKPAPPEKNPHPPQTEIDKKRVQFALEAVQLHLSQTLDPSLKDKFTILPVKKYENKDLACLKNIECYAREAQCLNNLIHFHNSYGKVIEVRHAHIIPWSIQKFKHHTPVTHGSSKNKTSKLTPRLARPIMSPIMLRADEYMVHHNRPVKIKRK